MTATPAATAPKAMEMVIKAASLISFQKQHAGQSLTDGRFLGDLGTFAAACRKYCAGNALHARDADNIVTWQCAARVFSKVLIGVVMALKQIRRASRLTAHGTPTGGFVRGMASTPFSGPVKLSRAETDAATLGLVCGLMTVLTAPDTSEPVTAQATTTRSRERADITLCRHQAERTADAPARAPGFALAA